MPASDVYQHGDCSTSSFNNMTQAFSQRIAELQQLVCFRVEDNVKHIFLRDIQGLEQSVRALECLFEDIRQRTKQELTALPKAQALLQAAQLQHLHLQNIANNLPQHLPSSRHDAALPSSQAAAEHPKQAHVASSSVSGARGPTASTTHDGKDSKGQSRRRKDAAAAAASTAVSASAPRWYVTAGEMSAVPSYMKGRLTLEKVNAALDELAGFAESIHKSMAAVARNQLGRMGAEERQRLHGMYHNIALKEGVKGRHWFPEMELKAGVAVKMDKTGKSILMLLRHLGRVSEVRAMVEGMGSVTAYVLQPSA